MPQLCYPAWHETLNGWKTSYSRAVVAPSGCAIQEGPPPVLTMDGGCQDVSIDRGFVLCSPEALRLHAENYLRQAGILARAFNNQLLLDTYSLARNIASEMGGRHTVEEKVCVGLSTMGQARLRGTTVSGLILSNKLGRRLYGAIHGYRVKSGMADIGSKCEQTTRRGRWTASTLPPTVLDLLIAQFCLTGQAGQAGDPSNFAGGADDQAQLQRDTDWMTFLARGKSYWVGDIAGVNPREITLFRKTDIPFNSAEGQALLRRGLAMQQRLVPKPMVTCNLGAAPLQGAMLLGLTSFLAYAIGKYAKDNSKVQDLFARL